MVSLLLVEQFRQVHRGMFSAFILLCPALLHLLDASKVTSACSLPFQQCCRYAPASVQGMQALWLAQAMRRLKALLTPALLASTLQMLGQMVDSWHP